MQTTLKKVIEFNNNALLYLKENLNKNTPFTYALSKVQKKCAAHIEKFKKTLHEYAEDLRIELCEKEKDGTLKEKTIGEGDNMQIQRIFLPLNLKKLAKDIKEKEDELIEDTVEVSEHFCKKEYIPKLNLFYIDAFMGFVIEPMEDDELEKWFVSQEENPTTA